MIPELAAMQLKLNEHDGSSLLALFAHNITVAARASEGETQLRALNEIVHRLTAELASQLGAEVGLAPTSWWLWMNSHDSAG